MWRALFSCCLRLEIRPFALLLTNTNGTNLLKVLLQLDMYLWRVTIVLLLPET